jgi:Amt family ammonium transporter
VAEEKYRSIFEHASEGIFRFGPNGRFLDANPALAQILGYPDPQTLVAEVLDIRTQLYVDPKSRYRLMEELTANAKALNFETQLYRRDGSAVDVSLSARMVVGVSGQYEYIEGSLCDITQRREFEKFLQEKEAAEAANRAKSAFLATMSHEIRTPLNGVIGMLELLSNSHLSEKQTRYTSIAKSSAQALLSLINDILDFSKIEAGKLELHQTDFDLLMLLEEIADMFGHRAEQKGLELSCHVLPDVPVRVYGDSERLRQVLINLVGNSLKFTERGEVRIRSKLLSAVNGRRTVRFEVEDTGVGIPPEVQSRLFQVFEQADSSTTRKYGGTGLGLAICRQLVELMGGKIGVTSKLGEGSQFWCEVPFEGANTPQPRRASEIRFRGLRVIAVDDNDTNLQIIETQLTNWGAEVVTARSAADALHILKLAHVQGQKFDLGILDHQMPEVDGVELAKRIHGDPNFQHILMIMLTSSDSPGEPKFLRSVGIRACCTKPILQSRLFDVLISTLHAAEHGPRLEHQPAAEESEAVGESTPAAAAPTGEARRILIADDNEINQMVSQEIIEKAGYQCRIANNGQEALDLLKKRYFDVVLMDCQMPVMDGFTAVKEIRRLQAAGQLPDSLPDPLPVIALTANAVAGDRERCLAAGMTDYVTKPVDPEQLLKVIGKLLPQTAGADIQTPESAPTPPAASEPAPVDWKALRDRCGGDGQFARRVIEKFHNRLGEDLKKIQSACQRRDFEESRRLAHSLKGSSSSVAATAVSESAAAIEMAAKSAAAEDVDRHLQELKGRVDRCLSYVAQNLDQAL